MGASCERIGVDDGHAASGYSAASGRASAPWRRREVVVDRRRIAVWGGLGVLGDERQLLARLLGLALTVPHAGVSPFCSSSSWCVPRSTISPVVEHDDLVGADDGGEPVRNHQRGAVLRHAFERVLDFLLGVAVERGGRLVEHQDRRRLEDGAGDGNALLLAAGKLQARARPTSVS